MNDRQMAPEKFDIQLLLKALFQIFIISRLTPKFGIIDEK
jgi:hypothetical protein